MAVARIPAARWWRVARKASRRLSWGIADQGMSSLTNFLLSAFVAHSLGAGQFGAFSLAYVTYGFAINASRGLAVEPLLVRFSGASVPAWRRATAGATGTALLVGMAGGVIALAAGALIGGTTGEAFSALGLMLPGLLLQDSWRYAFFALGKSHHAFINDTVWAAVQIPLLVLLKATGHAEVFWFVLAWGAAAGVGAVAGAFQAKVVPSLMMSAQWLVRHRDLGPRYLMKNAGSNSAAMLLTYSLTSVLGLVAVGEIQAASVLLGPFNIILFGVSLIVIPEGARVVRKSPCKLPLFCVAVSTGLVLLAVPWTAGLLLAMPRGLGHLLLGELWRPAYPLVVPTALAVMATCAATGANLGLQALGAARRSMRAVLVSAFLVVAAGFAGALVAGAAGSLYFVAVAAWTGCGLCWWQLRHALHDSPRVGVPRWMLTRSHGRDKVASTGGVTG